MKTVVVMDSFKGSLTSKEAGEAVKTGILKADGSADVRVFPFADGGEGTLDAFLAADNGKGRITIQVSDPLGRDVEASYGVLGDDTVVIEIAQAAGLCLLIEDERDTFAATTKGVGQLIRHAVEHGYRKFIIALGGSATNDCGIGMLQELGFEILDDKDEPVGYGAKGMSMAGSIRCDKTISELEDCEFTVACDVTNPLCGPNGASIVFSPQKGAGALQAEEMDVWMEHYADIVKKAIPEADPKAEGAGAAGGLGFAFMTFLKGKMRPGAQVLLERSGIEEAIASADLVVTGEGRIDAQTSMGKAPARIAAIAKKYHKPVIAIAGSVTDDADKCHEAGDRKSTRLNSSH